jgi:hypothetical protein
MMAFARSVGLTESVSFSAPMTRTFFAEPARIRSEATPRP